MIDKEKLVDLAKVIHEIKKEIYFDIMDKMKAIKVPNNSGGLLQGGSLSHYEFSVTDYNEMKFQANTSYSFVETYKTAYDRKIALGILNALEGKEYKESDLPDIQ